MKPINDIPTIRAYLSAFYAGESTPEQERALAEFFSDGNREAIPADMLADMRVVRTLIAPEPTADDVDVPSDLVRRLAEITDEAAVTSVRRRRPLRRIIMGIAAAAAAVCIAWGVAALIPAIGNGQQESGIAQADDYIEITDPEEAARIVEQIGDLLASNLNQSDRAIDRVGQSFQLYQNLTKNILK